MRYSYFNTPFNMSIENEKADKSDDRCSFFYHVYFKSYNSCKPTSNLTYTNLTTLSKILQKVQFR